MCSTTNIMPLSDCAVSDVADKLGLMGPVAEQCEHQCVDVACQCDTCSLTNSTISFSMLHRDRPESEYA